MLLRPVDASGDVLPVLSVSALLSGPEAVVQLVRYRLSQLSGEWWENPSLGFPALERLRSSRLSDSDTDSFASGITSYIRETPGVSDVTDVRFSVSGRRFSYACTVRTGEGSAALGYDFEI